MGAQGWAVGLRDCSFPELHASRYLFSRLGNAGIKLWLSCRLDAFFKDSMQLIKYKFQSINLRLIPAPHSPLPSQQNPLPTLPPPPSPLPPNYKTIPAFSISHSPFALQLKSELLMMMVHMFDNNIVILLHMQQTSPSYESMRQSTLRLHHVLQDYKQQQLAKSTLCNKVNILRQQSESNIRKTKLIQNQIAKISDIQQEYRRSKDQISQIIYTDRIKQQIKIARDKQRREVSKENIHVIKNIIAQERHQEYRQLKQQERINQFKITQNLQKSLHQKKQRSLQVKLKEEESRLTRTLFMENKRIQAQNNTQNDLIPLEKGLVRNQKCLEEMRELENLMLKKLNSSRQTLTRSKLSLRKALY